MKSLREHIQEAEGKKVAIGHFNISNLEGFHAIVNAGKKLNVPVIIGVSEGERDFVGIAEVAALVQTVREKTGQPVFLNADHTYSYGRIVTAIDEGFDSVIFDGAKLSFEENAKLAKRSVAYAKKSKKNVLVEGELGYIGQSSKILEEIPEGVKLNPEALTSPEDARKFVEETGVDLLAPSVGNIHGMLKGGVDPALDIDRIAAIRRACGVPLVLHGGSGNSADDFRKAIAAGVAIVHINTELRVAYRRGLEESLKEHPYEVSPYKYLEPAVAAMQKVVEAKLKLFNNL